VIVLRRLASTLALVPLAAFIAGAAACADPLTSPTATPPFSQTDLTVGTGPAVTSGNRVTVHYTGWLYNAVATDQKGAQIDSSRLGDPFTFTVGGGDVINGWSTGVVGMMAGGVRRLVIPPSLGYGGTRSGAVPPNASLVFEIELLAIE
jgi:FKBP-type peptidyl-prolyl cis-trans isomerase FkpA